MAEAAEALPDEAAGGEYQSELLPPLAEAVDDVAAPGFAQSEVELGSSVPGAKEGAGVGDDQSHELEESAGVGRAVLLPLA